MKELFHVRDKARKIVAGPFDDKIAAKRHRDELQGGKISTTQVAPEQPERRFFVTAGKDHHSKQLTGKW